MSSIPDTGNAEKLQVWLEDLNDLNFRISELEEFEDCKVLMFEEKIELWHLTVQWFILTGKINSLMGFGGSSIIL